MSKISLIVHLKTTKALLHIDFDLVLWLLNEKRTPRFVTFLFGLSFLSRKEGDNDVIRPLLSDTNKFCNRIDGFEDIPVPFVDSSAN